jgi:hypothetical protein
MKLFEVQAAEDINLSNSQKTILARIAAAPDPNMDGFKKLPLNDEKLVIALETLERILYVEKDPETDRIRITDAGLAAMREDGLVDENDQLTDYGRDLAVTPGGTGMPIPTAPPVVTTTPRNMSQGNGGQGSASSPAPSATGLNIPFQNESQKVSFKDYLKII